MSENNISFILTIIVLVGFIIYQGYQYYTRKKASTVLTEEEFRKGMRKAQLIDVREKNVFDGGHILGARNIPYTLFKTRMVEIRKDQPIYLYDQGRAVSARAAVKLRRAGYEDIYCLKGGYEKWTGKTKRK
ncbi:Rhodanese-related sulfurtransferase [Isobaculum melis]|uniref:Rhodanese-related sulfurtransferase n=1 Tax=Isobaculum melis TaxID=142588 RepID=A0A1H9RSH0_9LACT|nr:rhodanese-like domain-containing protein [Isobaculum melis]SER75891.1 Rhodanese-related sulfurtransferase [Isobaculum melis]